jgi:hypothetical protein
MVHGKGRFVVRQVPNITQRTAAHLEQKYKKLVSRSNILMSPLLRYLLWDKPTDPLGRIVR